jgi:DNA polymerase (family 10)
MSRESAFAFSKEEDGSVYYLFQENIQVILHSTDEENTDATLFFTTGTSAFNDAFQEAFPEVSFAGSSGEEDLIFEEAGIPFIEPCLRESKASIDLAQENKIPSLIQLNNIKGIIHNHSTWSDGGFSIAQMAQACIEKGFEYLVMSDHSVSSFYANGLSIERIKQQHEEIDMLNEKLKPFKIFKSIECDILNDGRLDYTDDILSSFDLVIASVHQNLKMTEEKAMMRLMGAIQNKYTRILGHLTGRLLLSRKEYPVNHQVIIDACKLHDVVIEINANPRRLDMDWQWISYAIEQGVLLSINPDAHSIRGIDDIRYGVLSAQKGMLTAKQNLSSFSLQEFENFLARKK